MKSGGAYCDTDDECQSYICLENSCTNETNSDAINKNNSSSGLTIIIAITLIMIVSFAVLTVFFCVKNTSNQEDSDFHSGSINSNQRG